MKRRSLVLSASAALVTVVVGGGAVIVPRLLSRAQNASPAFIGGPFQLIDGEGRTVTDANFRGRWMLVYFGYTHCPDACPTALSNITLALQSLGSQAAAVQPIFITVDPARDTPAVMKDYVSAFGPSVIGLSGSPDAIARAEKEYRVYAAKHSRKDGDYDMDHSSIIYVMDPQGRFVTNFTHETSPEQIANKLKQLAA